MNGHCGPWNERVKKPSRQIPVVPDSFTVKVWLLGIMRRLYGAIGDVFSLRRLSGAFLWK
jgi:hypothetical protein